MVSPEFAYLLLSFVWTVFFAVVAVMLLLSVLLSSILLSFVLLAVAAFWRVPVPFCPCAFKPEVNLLY